MAETIRCQECGKTLKVPEDLLGKKVKCGGCGTMFVAKVEATPARKSRRDDDDDDDDRTRRRRDDDDDDDDRPRRRRERDRDDDDDDDRRPRYRDDDDDDRGRKRRRRSEYDDDFNRPGFIYLAKPWGKVRFGIDLIFLALGLGFFALLFSMLSWVVAESRARAGDLGGLVMGFGAMWILSSVFVLFKEIANTVAHVFCAGAPANTRAKGLAVATLVMDGGVLFFYMIGFFLGMAGYDAGAIFIMVSVLFYTARWVIFPIYLKLIAEKLKHWTAANLCKYIVMIALTLIGTSVFWFVLTMIIGASVSPGSAVAAGRAWVIISMIVYVIMGLLALTGLVLYVMVLIFLRPLTTEKIMRA
jgi:phage FluMu protein Com